MVIGIDAGALSESNRDFHVGVYRVTYELIRELTTLDTINDYRLYSYAPIPPTILKDFDERVTSVILYPSYGYMRIRLPIELYFHPVDIFLGVAQALPKTSSKTIGFIYDIGFLYYRKLYENSNKLLKQTKYVCDTATHIITISQTSKNDIVRSFHIQPSKISVSYPGVSSVFFSKPKLRPHKVPYFLSVGLLKKGKNIKLIIDAFSQFLTMTQQTYDLILVGGDGGEKDTIEQYIKTFHLEKRIHLVGYQSDTNLVSWYTHALALLAFSPTEGFCLPAAESLVCECPVVYRKSGVLSEVVGSAGIGVQDDPKNIATAMVKILRYRPKISFVNHKSRFQWNVFAKQIYDILELL